LALKSFSASAGIQYSAKSRPSGPSIYRRWLMLGSSQVPFDPLDVELQLPDV
jgi:hypothetical protein